MSVQAILPRIMEIGGDASLKLPDVLNSLGCRRPLIITDKVMVKLGYAERLTSLLSERDIPSEVFDDTVPEPTAASIAAGVARV